MPIKKLSSFINQTKIQMTGTVNLLILIISFQVADPGGLFAQEQWKSVSNDDGVTIYSRKVAGHEESEFKGITDIDLPIEVIGAVLAEIPAYTGWFFKCLQAEKVPQISSTAYNFMVYISLGAPWPLWPRDVVYDVNIRIDRVSGKIEVGCKAVPEPAVSIQKGHVRITDSEPNDAFSDILGLPTIWVPHSYGGCSQHAPDEHLLAPIVREGLQIMAGLFWDLAENPPNVGGV